MVLVPHSVFVPLLALSLFGKYLGATVLGTGDWHIGFDSEEWGLIGQKGRRILSRSLGCRTSSASELPAGRRSWPACSRDWFRSRRLPLPAQERSTPAPGRLFPAVASDFQSPAAARPVPHCGSRSKAIAAALVSGSGS